MPGTPDPALGSEALTVAIACGAGAFAAAMPFAVRERLPAPWAFAVGGGLAYAAVSLGVWAGARFVTDLFPTATARVWLLVGGATAVVLVGHAAIPYYAYARWGLVAPLAGLFGATALVWYLFLRVGGESDPLAIYPFFGAAVVAGLCVLALVEAGVRRLIVAG
ncbi:hypothetical protein [Halorussus marinus]|uniref:hypothetical protein n=1 Tax=Halorussus marinus TaxID=2505976 RepID=UPI00106EA708|nr:hypothetical protein [Halorussus marinus]